MLSRLITGLTLISLVILQSTLLDQIKIFNTKPDLVLVFIILIALSLDLKWVMIFSYTAAVLQDALGALPYGLNTLVLPLLGFLSFRLSKKMVIETNYMKAAIMFLAVILKNLLFVVLLIALGRDISFGMFLKFSILGAFYTVVFFLLLSRIIKTPIFKFRL